MAGGKKTPSSQFRELTPEEYDECARLIDDGLPRNVIAKRMDRSTSSISKMAKSLGKTFDRSKTAAATEAFKVDMAARRARLAEDLLVDAERLRREIFSPALAFNFGGRDNTYEERIIPQPTHADQLKIVQGVGIALKTHLELLKHDQNDETDDVRAMLTNLGKALGIVQ